MSAKAGSPCPDFVYTTAQDESKRLSELWRDGPALVLWLRHFGWQFYAEILAQVRERLPEFEARGVRLACVVQGTAVEAARFCGRHGVEQICIPDPEKESYRAMGFPRTTWGKLLFASPELKQRRKESGEAGCSNSLTGALQEHSDVLQLPGAALIARGGNILWLHRGQHPGDVPLVEGLIEVVRQKVAPGS